jgi:hypothetical protein
VRVNFNNINLPNIRINEVSQGNNTSYGQNSHDGGTPSLSINVIDFDANIVGNIGNDGFDGIVQNQNRFDKPVFWRVRIANGDWLPGWDETQYTTVVRNAGGGPDNIITLTGPNGSTITATATPDFNPQVDFRGNGDPRRIRDGIFFEFDVSSAVESGTYSAIGGLQVEITGSPIASENFLLGCP